MARARNWFDRFYGDGSLADRVVLCGDVSECADGLLALADVGADLLILNPVYDELAQLRALSDVLASAAT
jgi:hypothetical protein